MNITEAYSKSVLGEIFTTKDLAMYKLLNKQSFSASYKLFGFEGLARGSYNNNSLITNLIRSFKNFNFHNWKYSNLPESLSNDVIEILEGHLWTWGRVAIVKLKKNKDDYFCGTFEILRKDRYGLPKKIKIKNHYGNEFMTNLVVGKDCVIIYNDTSFLLPNMKIPIGTLFYISGMLLELNSIYQQFLTEVAVSQNLIITSKDLSTDNVMALEALITSGKKVLPLSSGYAGAGDRNRNFEIANFNDKTEILRECFNFVYHKILDTLGVENDSSMDKKERKLTNEIEMTNTLPNANLEAQLQQRKQGWERFNKVFGENVKVELNEKEKEKEKEIIEGGNDNENENK